MLPRVIAVCALCAYRALTIEKARQLLEAAMQYAGHRRAVEKALDEVKALQAKERAAAERAAKPAAEEAVAEKAAASIATLKHTNDVRSVCSLGDGRLASGSDDRTVRVWAATALG